MQRHALSVSRLMTGIAVLAVGLAVGVTIAMFQALYYLLG